MSDIIVLKTASVLLEKGNIEDACMLLRQCKGVPANVWGQIEQSTWFRMQAKMILDDHIASLTAAAK